MSGLVMDVDNTGTENNVPIILWKPKQTLNQLFKLELADQNNFTHTLSCSISPLITPILVFDINYSKQEEQTQIIAYKYHGKDN